MIPYKVKVEAKGKRSLLSIRSHKERDRLEKHLSIYGGEIIEDDVKEAGRAEQTADNYISKKRTGGGDGV